MILMIAVTIVVIIIQIAMIIFLPSTRPACLSWENTSGNS